MKIGAITERTDIPASTIRYYESIELIPLAKRVNGQRDYSAEIVPLLRLIQFAKAVGFNLEEIHQLLNQNNDESWRELALDKINALNDSIRAYKLMREALQSAIECKCLDEALVLIGDDSNGDLQ
ncbi:MAG: MerR family transcriptional regulator [Chloroflexi bacterium]|nr:MAG: MerR family transcriptional regulator [Chloroflexota bacterium]MBL1195065.1 MerR family transcriptional regulator [Chloroflexota bacterium]NOH12353.1 MerR family transcriptional regulator [Chloroflexota bacterium]